MPPKRKGKRGAAARKNQAKKENDPLTEAKRKQLEILLVEFDKELENRINSAKSDLITTCRGIQTFYEGQLLAIPSQFHDLKTEEYKAMKEKLDLEKKEKAKIGAYGIVDMSLVLQRIENCNAASTIKKVRMKKLTTGSKPQKRLTRVSEKVNTVGGQTTRRALAQMQETATPISKKHGLPVNFTPSRKKAAVNATPSITPKFDPRKPLLSSALRKAKAGEIVMSMAGSPLLNTADVEYKPGLLVSLGGGKVLNFSDISHLSNINLDQSTKRTLKVVNDKLAQILSSTR